MTSNCLWAVGGGSILVTSGSGDIHAVNPGLAVITALPEEHAAVYRLMTKREQDERSDGRFLYIRGTLPASHGDHSIVLASCPKPANNTAAIIADNLLHAFPTVQELIFVGVAAGVPRPHRPLEHVRLGDVVVATKGVLQFDYGVRTPSTFEVRGFAQSPSSYLLQGVNVLQSRILAGDFDWCKHVSRFLSRSNVARPNHEPRHAFRHPRDRDRVHGFPRIHYGIIGASNTLLRDADYRDRVAESHSLLAFEMEGSGVSDVAWINRVGYLLVRGICDYGDVNKDDSWHVYASYVAGAYFGALLRCIPPIPTSIQVSQTAINVHSAPRSLDTTAELGMSDVQGHFDVGSRSSPHFLRSLSGALDPDANGNFPSLLSPIMSESRLREELESCVGREGAQHLLNLNKSIVNATESGDFVQFTNLGSELIASSDLHRAVATTGHYLIAEGHRLQAGLESDAMTRHDLVQAAESHYGIALELDNNNVHALRGLGRTKQDLHDLDAALRLYRRARILIDHRLDLGGPHDALRGFDHEILRTSRHYVDCLIAMRETDPRSTWNRENMRRELEGYLNQCENIHRVKVPVFQHQDTWTNFEWFSGYLFLAKAWGSLGENARMIRMLLYALSAKRRTIRTEVSSVDRSNLTWWLGVAKSEVATKSDREFGDGVRLLEDALRRGNSAEVKAHLDNIIETFLPPWSRHDFRAS